MIVRVYSDIDLLPAGHLDRIQAYTKNHFFYCESWFRALIKTTIKSNVALKFYAVEDEKSANQLRCFLPARCPANKKGSILRFHGVGQNSLSGITGHQTILFSPAFSPKDPDLERVFQVLAQHLYSEKPKWETIDLSALDMEPNTLAIFKTAFSEAGYSVHMYRSYSNWYEPVSGNFHTYLGQLPKRNRKAVKNYIRKHRKLDSSGKITFVIHDTIKDVVSAINDYETVFSESWKDKDHHPKFGCVPPFTSAKIRPVFECP